MTAAAFVHRQSAHCESGVVSAMLTHHGLPLSEPMAFGLASALTFARIPLVKISGMPLIAYRMPPRSIIRGVDVFGQEAPVVKACQRVADAGAFQHA